MRSVNNNFLTTLETAPVPPLELSVSYDQHETPETYSYISNPHTYSGLILSSVLEENKLGLHIASAANTSHLELIIRLLNEEKFVHMPPMVGKPDTDFGVHFGYDDQPNELGERGAFSNVFMRNEVESDTSLSIARAAIVYTGLAMTGLFNQDAVRTSLSFGYDDTQRRTFSRDELSALRQYAFTC